MSRPCAARSPVSPSSPRMGSICRARRPMTAPIFVDTNVLIYALDNADLSKQRAARLWRAELWNSRRGRISYQVLQEFYVKVTQKWPAAQEQVCAEVRDLLTWRPVTVEAEILEQSWKIQDRYRLSFWDRSEERRVGKECRSRWS